MSERLRSVRAVCEELSTALGWRIDYVADTAVVVPPPVTAALFPADTEAPGQMRVQQALSPAPRADHALAVETARAVTHLVHELQAAQTELQSRSRQVSTLLTLSHADSAEDDLTSVLQRMVAGAAELTACWGTALFLADPTRDALQLRAAARINPDEIPAWERSRSKPSPDAQALACGALLLERRTAQTESWLPRECTTAVAVPVWCSSGPIGTLWSYERRRLPFTTARVQALQTVASQIGRTIEHRVLEHESSVRRRIHDELRIASKQQARSRRWKPCPQGNLDVALRTASASELSGDLCEIFSPGNGRTSFAVGDAVGHSIPAAMVMAVARGAIRALWEQAPGGDWQPEILLQHINRTLCNATAAEQFMSLITGHIDEKQRTLTYANAGHPPPWLWRRGERITLKSHGLLCGVLPQSTYQAEHVTLQPGDIVCFFTDGITEALSSHSRLLRAEGLLDALSESTTVDAESAATAIWQRLQDHQGPLAAKDDQTLIVAHIRAE